MTAAPFSIRHATANDANGILDCLRSAFEPYREAYTPAAYRDTVLDHQTVHERLASMSVLVAVTVNGEIIGTIAAQATSRTEGHLRGMAVLPPYQATGVAGRLMKAAEHELARQGCSSVSLDTTEPLQRAVRFYERHGFRASGRVTDFFGMRLIEYLKDLT